LVQTVKSKVLPADLTEIRAASTASGGTALTTTATGTGTPTALGIVPIPAGADYLSITGRNFVGCAVVRVSLNPYLTIFYTVDAGVNVTDISAEMQDGDTTDVAIDSFAITPTGFMYVGADLPFRGVAIDVGTGPNGTANNLTVKYWNGGAWVDISDTDATDTGASLAVDGTVTWTVPAAWTKASLSETGDTLPKPQSEGEKLYWTRWEWSAAMDSDTDIAQMFALNRSTAYAEYIEGQTLEVGLTNRRIGCVQCITNAGTANLMVNVGAIAAEEFE